MTIDCNDGNIRKAAVGKFEIALDTMIEQAMRSTAFGKISSVYGHIAENGSLVRKWFARKMAITDKIGKNSLLSVRFQPLRTRFYGQMLRKEAFVRKSSS